jgi:hypothetical protein
MILKRIAGYNQTNQTDQQGEELFLKDHIRRGRKGNP